MKNFICWLVFQLRKFSCRRDGSHLDFCEKSNVTLCAAIVGNLEGHPSPPRLRHSTQVVATRFHGNDPIVMEIGMFIPHYIRWKMISMFTDWFVGDEMGMTVWLLFSRASQA